MKGLMVRLISLFFILVSVTEIFAQQKSDEEFVLVRRDRNVAIYERWITFPKSNQPVKAREMKGEFTANASVEDAFDLLRDESRIREWQRQLKEFRIYSRTDTSWIEYSYHDIHWPVSDQDQLLQYTVKKRKPGQEMLITFDTPAKSNLAPLRQDVNRMYLSGSWHIQKLNSGKVHITYRVLSKPIGVPRMFTDPVIRGNLMTNLKSYVQVLESEE